MAPPCWLHWCAEGCCRGACNFSRLPCTHAWLATCLPGCFSIQHMWRCPTLQGYLLVLFDCPISLLSLAWLLVLALAFVYQPLPGRWQEQDGGSSALQAAMQGLVQRLGACNSTCLVLSGWLAGCAIARWQSKQQALRHSSVHYRWPARVPATLAGRALGPAAAPGCLCSCRLCCPGAAAGSRCGGCGWLDLSAGGCAGFCAVSGGAQPPSPRAGAGCPAAAPAGPAGPAGPAAPRLLPGHAAQAAAGGCTDP